MIIRQHAELIDMIGQQVAWEAPIQLIVYSDGDTRHNPKSFGGSLVQQISLMDYDTLINRHTETIFGTPRYFACHPTRNVILIWPRPDKELFCRLLYYPPLCEL